MNGDGRPDLYVANDEDPNDLYVNVAWPGGAAADPAGLGFRFEERGQSAGVADPFAGMGVAAQDGKLFVTNSRGEPPAAYRLGKDGFANARPQLDRRLGTGFAGWGTTWVDLRNSGRPDLVLAAGAIPVTGLQRSAEAVRVLTPAGVAVLTSLPRNGRGVAAADVGNDGRMTVAVNTIGGGLLLLRPTGRVGHWLDVRLDRFVPGAVVTAAGDSRELQAGSSYLSSEDPRAHFGLGTRTVVPRLVVRYPWGAQTVLRNVRGDRIVDVHVPARPAARVVTTAAHSCATPKLSHARFWNDVARRVVTDGGAPATVQARDLYLSSLATWRAYRSETTLPAQNAAIDRANYRLLLWLASFDHDLARVFRVVDAAYATVCSPKSASGDRIAAALIARSVDDGSNERLHYADPTFVPQNAPLIVGRPGGVLHDPTFWQPLALAQISPRGAGAVPAQVQSFVGSQWGRVRTFALRRPLDPGSPHLGYPDGKAYAAAALSAIRATADRVVPAAFTPSMANEKLPSLGLRADAKLDLKLNGALNDAAVAVYRAKRRYDAPRPIEMIRYLAFNHELPLVPGLTRQVGAVVQVRLGGRWVRGDRWTPPQVTPPSPGWPSADAAFAAAAHMVLARLAPAAAPPLPRGSGGGIELPMDVAAGRKLGVAAGRLALGR